MRKSSVLSISNNKKIFFYVRKYSSDEKGIGTRMYYLSQSPVSTLQQIINPQSYCKRERNNP